MVSKWTLVNILLLTLLPMLAECVLGGYIRVRLAAQGKWKVQVNGNTANVNVGVIGPQPQDQPLIAPDMIEDRLAEFAMFTRQTWVTVAIQVIPQFMSASSSLMASVWFNGYQLTYTGRPEWTYFEGPWTSAMCVAGPLANWSTTSQCSSAPMATNRYGVSYTDWISQGTNSGSISWIGPKLGCYSAAQPVYWTARVFLNFTGIVQQQSYDSSEPESIITDSSPILSYTVGNSAKFPKYDRVQVMYVASEFSNVYVDEIPVISERQDSQSLASHSPWLILNNHTWYVPSGPHIVAFHVLWTGAFFANYRYLAFGGLVNNLQRFGSSATSGNSKCLYSTSVPASNWTQLSYDDSSWTVVGLNNFCFISQAGNFANLLEYYMSDGNIQAVWTDTTNCGPTISMSIPIPNHFFVRCRIDHVNSTTSTISSKAFVPSTRSKTSAATASVQAANSISTPLDDLDGFPFQIFVIIVVAGVLVAALSGFVIGFKHQNRKYALPKFAGNLGGHSSQEFMQNGERIGRPLSFTEAFSRQGTMPRTLNSPSNGTGQSYTAPYQFNQANIMPYQMNQQSNTAPYAINALKSTSNVVKGSGSADKMNGDGKKTKAGVSDEPTLDELIRFQKQFT